jgi:hypothetical protein
MYNKTPLTETITVTRPVDDRIADLVNFYKYVVSYEGHVDPKTQSLAQDDKRLITLASRFWDMEHGE